MPPSSAGSNPFNQPPAQTPHISAEIRKPYPAHVLEYLQNIKTQILAIYDKYNVSGNRELAVYAEKHPSLQIIDDLEQLQKLWEAGVKCKETGRLPEKEMFNEIIEHEQQKLREFFGRDIEVPPLPEGITLEKIQAWEKQQLKLHYLPLIDMAKETELEH